MMQTFSDISMLRKHLSSQRSDGRRIGFVPTMGALHAGHMALVERAKAENDAVVVSIFVNPLQFGAGEDLERYPRPLEQDAALLKQAKVDYLYTPSVDSMYPEGYKTTIHVDKLGERYCGAARPGHFDGVCTVVCKLLNHVQPDRAYFGEKDYQQLCIIRQMVADLALPITIAGVSTLRESDGLAMSSRNQYLSETERALAPMLHEIMQKAAKAMREGQGVDSILEEARHSLKQKGFAKVDYFALCRADSLEPIEVPEAGARLLAAAYMGNTRLIDNIEVIGT